MRPVRRLPACAAALLLALAVALPAALAADDPLRHMQYGLDRIEAEPAWARARGAGVVIAVIDTGVHLTHEDLRDKLVPGYDFVEDHDRPMDRNGHGTHVAGIAAAATDNGLGIAGVAPAAMIMPLRVLDADGTGVEPDVAAAIRFAVLQASSSNLRLVINLSLTDLKGQGAPDSRQIRDAIREAWFSGAVIVAAAGNEDMHFSDYPAAGPNVLSVGATDASDGRAPFSNRQPTVVAPGDRIVSTFWDPADPSDNAAYAAGSGTSMAAPHVSGIAALLLSAGLTNEEAVDRIVRTADDLGEPGQDPEFGFGRVNAARALGVSASGTFEAIVPEGSLGLEAQFEKVPVGAEQGSQVAAAPPEVPAASRTVPVAAALTALALAYAATRWNAGVEAERMRRRPSVWEI